MPSQRHVFIIDDDPCSRRDLGWVITQAGLTWDAYESIDGFIATANLGRSGCVLADMMMFGVSGFDFKKRLNDTRLKLPLIILTTEDTEDIRAAARGAGAVGLFRKPVDTQALLDAIEWALHEPADRKPASPAEPNCSAAVPGPPEQD